MDTRPSHGANADVIVVGAGLAGLVAARELTALGHEVAVLEARERVGGRTWSVTFEQVGARVDLGAEWISPRHHRAMAAEIQRYGLPTAEPVEGERHWNLAGCRAAGKAPLSSAENSDLAAAVAHMNADAARIEFDQPDWHADLTDLDVPFAQYLEKLPGSIVVKALLSAWAFELMGADEQEYSTLSLLHEFAGFGTPEEAVEGESLRIADGADAVARAIAADLGDAIHLGRQVTAVTVDAGVCVVTAGDGARNTARAVIVAVPVNTLNDITFTPRPPLPEPHIGRVAKIWARVDGITSGTAFSGWPGLVETYTITGEAGFAAAGFQLHDPATDQISTFVQEFQRALPHAHLAAPLWHDWCADPYARGTWSASRPGHLAQWHALAQHPGPVVFAGGDISRRWIGWMDGAVTSGADAALRTHARLSEQPVPLSRG